MSRTLGDCRSDLRDRLDETSARFWDDKQLNRWINEGALDVSRRAETNYATKSITVTAGTQSYSLPTDGFTLHYAEFTYDSGVHQYPLQFREMHEMEGYWTFRTQQAARPEILVPQGYPPNWTCLLFPVPSQSGSLTVYYYRLAATANSDTDAVDLPAGWEDLAILYASYIALRKDKSQDWQQAKQEYEEKLLTMIDTTRKYTDQSGWITSGGAYVPWWLAGVDSEFG